MIVVASVALGADPERQVRCTGEGDLDGDGRPDAWRVLEAPGETTFAEVTVGDRSWRLEPMELGNYRCQHRGAPALVG